MTYWEDIFRFHEKAHVGDPSGKWGLEAIRSIRDLIGADWQPDARHPLRSKLMISSEPNYMWLISFVQKLKKVSKILGSDHVLARFGSSDTYLGALGEMDFALKVTLSGHPCKFTFRRGEPSPDLVAEVAGQETDIEVTSLNQPYDDIAWTYAIDLVTDCNQCPMPLWGNVGSCSSTKGNRRC